jgi:hypothetical protein
MFCVHCLTLGFGHARSSLVRLEKRPPAAYGGEMCRNITMLRGLDPPATHEEIHAAALQYARKVAAVTSGPLLYSPAFSEAVDQIAAVTERLLGAMPPRRTPPPMVPPNRRRTVPKI